jgi:hypothetical protein
MSNDEVCMFTPMVEVRLAKERNDVNQVYTCIEQWSWYTESVKEM